MLILVLLGMYFDAGVVFVKTFLLLFRLAQAILWAVKYSAADPLFQFLFVGIILL